MLKVFINSLADLIGFSYVVYFEGYLITLVVKEQGIV
jgi:hypothetical protein